MYLLRLEEIGGDETAYIRQARVKIADNVSASVANLFSWPGRTPWVAEITGRHPRFKLDRVFQGFKKDYASANSCGSRGVYLHFELTDGIYEVLEFMSWRRSRRYFLRVAGTTAKEIDRCEVEAWLNADLG